MAEYLASTSAMSRGTSKLFCHACQRHFRGHETVLICSRCQSDVVEIVPSYYYAIPSATDPEPPCLDNTLLEVMLHDTGAYGSEEESGGSSSGSNMAPFELSDFEEVLAEESPVNRRMVTVETILHFMNQGMNFGQEAAMPLTSRQIAAIPKIQITDPKQLEKCSVCWEFYMMTETVSKLSCNHLFHTECLEPWLRQHGSCPVCRDQIAGEDTGSGAAPPGQGFHLQAIPMSFYREYQRGSRRNGQ